MSDMYWVVPVDSWPRFDIAPDEFMEMLDQFDEYFGYAVKSLVTAGEDEPV